jgi:hypothetical protein
MWWLHNKMLRSVAKAAVLGTAVTVGSATVSCVFAICIERAAHRALFTYFPHCYADVDYAFGIESWELDAVRRKPISCKEENDVPERPLEIVETTVQQTLGLPSVSEKHIISCSMTS